MNVKELSDEELLSALGVEQTVAPVQEAPDIQPSTDLSQLSDEELLAALSGVSQLTKTKQPRQRSTIENIVGGAQLLGQGLSFGTTDELQAATEAAVNIVFGSPYEEYENEVKSFGELYDGYLKAAREDIQQYREDNPITAAVLEGTGLVVTGVLTGGSTMAAGTAVLNASKLAQGVSRLALTARASKPVAEAAGRVAQTGTLFGGIAAAEGGLYGFGVGEETLANRLKSASDYAKTGFAVGAGLGVAGSTVANVYRARKVAQQSTEARITLEESYTRALATEGDAALKDGQAALIARVAQENGISPEQAAVVQSNAPLRVPVTPDEAAVQLKAIDSLHEANITPITMTTRATQQLDKLAGQIRTRVGGLSGQFKRMLDDVEAEHFTRIGEYQTRLDNLNLINTLNDDTISALKVSLRMGDREAVNGILGNLGKTGQKIKQSLDTWYDDISKEIYNDGVKLKMFGEGEGLANYFPAVVKPSTFKEFQETLHGIAPKGVLTKSLESYRKALGVDELTPDQYNHALEMLGRGKVFKSRVQGMPRPGFTRERSLDMVTTRLAKYYEDPVQAMTHYLNRVVDESAFRRSFGLDAIVRQKIGASKALKAKGLKPEGSYDVDTDMRRLLEEKVEREGGTMTTAQREELVNLLEARFLARSNAPHRMLQGVQNLSTAFALGHFKSAALQVADVMASVRHNGLGATAKVVAKAMFPNDSNAWKVMDLGLDQARIAELSGQTNGITGTAAKTSLKYSGFTGMDKLGKFTHINALHNKFTAMAKNDKAWGKLSKQLEGEYTAAEMNALRSEFASGVTGATASPRMKSFMFSQILDRLPISKSNMPELWARNPNARFLYQLKSFGLQQADILRRQVYREWKAGNKAEATKNFISFMAVIGGSNALIDEARRVAFQDKPLDYAIEDLPENFAWQSIMLATVIGSPYLLQNVQSGLGSGVYDVGKPAFLTFVDAMANDANNLATNGLPESITELKTVQRFPLLGDPLRYWIGEGGEKWEKGR